LLSNPHAIPDGRRWRSLDELSLATVAWVGWYNHDRLDSALDDRSPAESEMIRSDNSPMLSAR
jgi:transposase InsO family protein